MRIHLLALHQPLNRLSLSYLVFFCPITNYSSRFCPKRQKNNFPNYHHHHKSSSNENPSIRSSSNGNNTSIKSSIKSFHQIHQSNLLWDNKSYQNKSSIKSATGPNQCSWPNPFAKAINLGGLGRLALLERDWDKHSMPS